MRHQTILKIAVFAGATAVMLGAFGAHAIEGWTATLDDGPKRLEWWNTATKYHFWHALMLLAVASLSQKDVNGRFGLPTILGSAGILLFSGSLYAMTLTGITKLGMITPIGGLLLIAAWIAIGVRASRGGA